MPDLHLKTAIQTLGHTRALKDGTVTPQGFTFEFEEVAPIIQAFRRMARGSFDPKQLEGQRVGVNRGYTVTTGVWARGVLQHQYGVDLSKITWVLSGDEHVAEFMAPSNVVRIEPGQQLDQMLLSGEIAAATGLATDHPDLKPLIPDAKAAGFAALERDGYYPINHTVVVRDELLEANPQLAAQLFGSFAEAKRLYVAGLRAGAIAEPTAADMLYARVMQITGADPLPYGVEPNRPMLEMVVRLAAEQGIIAAPYPIEQLFAAGTLQLAA